MDFKFYFKISIDILIDSFNYWLLLINDDKVFNIDFTFYFHDHKINKKFYLIKVICTLHKHKIWI